MTLSAGTKLSHYEISFPLGKGGMGEVYQAKDQKLGRDVAIKVLPEEFAKDAERVARFQREAKLLASLNHPNIAAIHGLEESDGTHFLVLELIEGDTLEDHIAGNAGVPAGKNAAETAALPGLLKLALQIAEALEAAHEKGVIHRDLKPANIKVTPDGKVKVLDFGLAKAFTGDQEDMNFSNSPTLSAAATQQGIILGTAAYMSPEQARGKEVDKRTDVWAFGVVLYEMLTGRSLFSGEDVSSTLARVLEREPDFSALPMNIHPRIRLLLERCLKKDPKDRYGAISDARVDIQDAVADPGGVIVKPVAKVKPQAQSKQILSWAFITVILLILAIIAAWKLKPVKPGEVAKLAYNLPEAHKFASHPGAIHAVAPDGTSFVYSTDEGLYLRSLEEEDAKLIPGTEGTLNVDPFFSHDGDWIGYYSNDDQKLKKMPIAGGMPFSLCDTPLGISGANWCADDTILYGNVYGDIMRIPADGGEPECIVCMEESVHLAFPQLLPGGEFLLCTVENEGADPKVMLYSLKSEDSKALFSGRNARYLRTGHIIYVVGNALYARPFDLDRLEPTGDPFAVVEDIFLADITPIYDVSDSGTLIYISTSPNEMVMPVWVDKSGNEEPIVINPKTYLFPDISPDGKKVSFTVVEENRNWDIWILDLIHNSPRRLTFKINDTLSLWTPDSNKILYSARGGIYRRTADGRGDVETLISLPDTGRIHPWSWSKDGKTLVLGDDTGTGDIRVWSMEGNGEIKPLLNEKYAERRPQVSPDGRWIAYEANQEDRSEIYVRPFPDVDDGTWQVSTNGGRNPLWSQDGSELFYRNGYEVMAVSVKSVESDTAFVYEIPPRTLFRKYYAIGPTSAGTFWDIHPDGKFLMLKESPISSINVFVNWFEELKELVPIPKR